MSRLPALSVGVALLLITPAVLAVQVPSSRDAGITGVVLTPDGSPVTQGSVMLMTSPANHVTATIDRTGQFRIVPDSPGWQRLFVSVPGFAPHRLHITVPPSRLVALPDITLNEATYFRARFVTTDGEPLAVGGLRRRAVDSDGVTIADPLGHVREQIDADGWLVLGPLPPGRTLLAFDRPPLAQTRLRDVDVTGAKPVIDGGVITIDRGARLHVDVVDGEGKPVPRHDVWIEDAVVRRCCSFQHCEPTTRDTSSSIASPPDAFASGRERWSAAALSSSQSRGWCRPPAVEKRVLESRLAAVRNSELPRRLVRCPGETCLCRRTRRSSRHGKHA